MILKNVISTMFQYIVLARNRLVNDLVTLRVETYILDALSITNLWQNFRSFILHLLGECVISLKSFVTGEKQEIECQLTHLGYKTGILK